MIDHLKKVIVAAEMLNVPIVGTFVGRDKNKTLEENLDEFAKVWPPIVKFAGDHGVKIAIENCPMIFSNDEWPGGNNLAISPYIWRKMWEIIPDQNFGLNLDPSHLIWQMIDVRARGVRVRPAHLPRARQGPAHRSGAAVSARRACRWAWAGRFRASPAWAM